MSVYLSRLGVASLKLDAASSFKRRQCHAINATELQDAADATPKQEKKRKCVPCD